MRNKLYYSWRLGCTKDYVLRNYYSKAYAGSIYLPLGPTSSHPMCLA